MSNTFVVDSVGGISGSLTTLVDGTSYLVAGDNVSIVSQSNGSILLSCSSGVSNINSSGSNLGFYSTTPVVQPTRLGHLGTFDSDQLANVSATSSDIQSNFQSVRNKMNDVIAKMNAIESAISQAGGGIGITQ